MEIHTKTPHQSLRKRLGHIRATKIKLERQDGNMDDLEKLYKKIADITANEEPLAAAGVMMAQALSIYKAMLNEEEFDRLTNHILNSTDDIRVDNGPGPVIH